MKRFKEIAIGFIVVAAVSWLVVFIYQQESRKTNRDLARRIAELSPKGGPPQTIEGLRQAIAIYEDQIERNVREGAQTGAYWKILAIRLHDRGMYQDALSALERAIYYNADDPFLFNLTGMTAGMIAKSIVGFSPNAENERAHYYTLAENAYKRALELESTYARPMYGLAVLYVYELNRPAEAIPFLERYISIQSNDVNAMFVLAGAYYLLENYTQAIETYERIISRTRDRQAQAEALNNIEIIQRSRYE